MEENKKIFLDGKIEQGTEKIKETAGKVEDKVLEIGADSKLKVGMFKGIQTRIMTLVFASVVISIVMFLWMGIPMYRQAVNADAKTPEQMEAAKALVNDFIIRNVGVSLIILVLIGIVAWFVSKSIAKPIRLLTSVIDKNANLDFTASKESTMLSKGKGETAVMSQSLELLRENIRDIMSGLSEQSENMKKSASGLKVIVQELNGNSCDNSASSEELAASMQETSASTNRIDDKMMDIEESTKMIGNLTVEGEEAADKIIDKADELRRNSEEANAKAKDIYSKVKSESETAIAKARDINRINELAEAISDIASQTELLSLNASIEAARAGEQGKGFAVVASEISTLASQSTETASGIADIVISVKDAAERMEKCIRQMIEFMENTVICDYQNFISVSEEYSYDAKQFLGSMKTINGSIVDLRSNVETIASAIQGINSTVGEAANSINDIAEKASDVVGYASDTGELAEKNAKLADDIDTIVGRFKL